MRVENQTAIQGFVFNEKLNEKSISKYTSGNLSFCYKIFKMLVGTLPSSLEDLDGAIDAKDYPTIQSITHNLKSYFRIIGLENIGQLLAQTEKLASQESNELLDIYQNLKPELDLAMSIISEDTTRLNSYLQRQN